MSAAFPGNDFVLTGNIDTNEDGDYLDPGDFSGSVTGEIVAYGIEDADGTNDFADFRFEVTGGDLAGFFADTDMGVVLSFEFSTFTGSFLVPFEGSPVKGSLGPNPAKLGQKYNDLNADGDNEGGTDPGLAGWTIAAFRDNNNDGQLDAGDTLAATDVTDANGNYQLFGLVPTIQTIQALTCNTSSSSGSPIRIPLAGKPRR